MEVDDSISQHWNFLPRNLGKVADGHWAYRALESDKRKGITIIDGRELMEFLHSSKKYLCYFPRQVKRQRKKPVRLSRSGVDISWGTGNLDLSSAFFAANSSKRITEV